MKKFLALLLAVMMLTLGACSNASAPAEEAPAEEPAPVEEETPTEEAPAEEAPEVQYDYQLKAGEPTEVYGTTFDEMVTVTVDPASTRDGALELRSNIFFDNCTFNAGLTVVGDYHAIVSLGAGCTFGDGASVTFQEATPGAAKEVTLEDNLLKLTVECEGVSVETQAAVGVLSQGPDVVINGTTYSKAELAPDAAMLAVYSVYEGDELTAVKMAIGEDESVEVLE